MSYVAVNYLVNPLAPLGRPQTPRMAQCHPRRPSTKDSLDSVHMEIQTMATISPLLIRVAVLVLATPPLLASADEVHCPKTHAGSQLTTATLFDGPPSEHADLMPDTSHETKNGSQTKWDVAYLFKLGRQLFVECQYGPKGSTVILEPKPSTDKCEFLSQRDKTVSLTCQSH
jgi:hypothetical protein